MTSALAGAYDSGAEGWARGPERVYERLADRLVSHAEPIVGRSALDAGTGSGAAARSLQRRGAAVVACDLTHGMLTYRRAERPAAAVGDITRLPFRDGVVDIAVAAFVVNHLSEPARGLRELARVTCRTGGVVLASSFARGDEPEIKRVVETVATAFGWKRPQWYDELKSHVATHAETPAQLELALRQAGLNDCEAWPERVDFGDLDAATLVAWRLWAPAMAAFVAALEPTARRELEEAAAAAVVAAPPVALTMLIGRGRQAR